MVLLSHAGGGWGQQKGFCRLVTTKATSTLVLKQSRRLLPPQHCPSLIKAGSNSICWDLIFRVLLAKAGCLVCVLPLCLSESCSISVYVKGKAIDF